MELHFFKEFLMISHPTTVFFSSFSFDSRHDPSFGEKKGTSFGKLVTIGTVSGTLLGFLFRSSPDFGRSTKVVFIK